MKMTDSFIHSSAWRRIAAEVKANESICYLCGRPVDKALPVSSPYSAAVDHVTARSSGGSEEDMSNLHLVHKICNSQKSDLTLSEYRFRQASKAQHSREW